VGIEVVRSAFVLHVRGRVGFGLEGPSREYSAVNPSSIRFRAGTALNARPAGWGGQS